jgi:two-component system, NtrC family, response regulator AtoC
MDLAEALRGAMVLIVEDDETLAHFTAQYLSNAGATVEVAPTLAAARAVLKRVQVDLALFDLHLPDGLSTTLLAEAREEDPDLAVIMITQRSTVRIAVEALHLGALDFLEKPYQQDDLNLAIVRAMTMDGLRREIRQLRHVTQIGKEAIVQGASAAMRRVWEQVEHVAAQPTTVLITGENGTGKEVIAQTLHASSQRARGPLIPVNCSSIPENLVEDSLFGHDPGGFTDATKVRRGDFELADKGTLFLDEIGDMPLSGQAKLLRAIETRKITRLGGEREIHVDVRIIAATNVDLELAQQQGRFRSDLFFRLNVFPIHVPPLRERREDIPMLLAAFLRDIGKNLGKPRRRMHAATLRLLVAYDWPGNVRQVRNVVERALIFCQGDEILPEHLPPEITGGQTLQMAAVNMDVLWERWLDGAPFQNLDINEAKSQVERMLVQRALRQFGGNRSEAARSLGLTPESLGYYLKKHRLLEDK